MGPPADLEKILPPPEALEEEIGLAVALEIVALV